MSSSGEPDVSVSKFAEAMARQAWEDAREWGLRASKLWVMKEYGES